MKLIVAAAFAVAALASENRGIDVTGEISGCPASVHDPNHVALAHHLIARNADGYAGVWVKYYFAVPKKMESGENFPDYQIYFNCPTCDNTFASVEGTIGKDYVYDSSNTSHNANWSTCNVSTDADCKTLVDNCTEFNFIRYVRKWRNFHEDTELHTTLRNDHWNYLGEVNFNQFNDEMVTIVDSATTTKQVSTKRRYSHQQRYQFEVRASQTLQEQSGDFLVHDHDYSITGSVKMHAQCANADIAHPDLLKSVKDNFAKWLCDSHVNDVRQINGGEEQMCKVENVETHGLDQNGIGLEVQNNEGQLVVLVPFKMGDVTVLEAKALQPNYCSKLHTYMKTVTQGGCTFDVEIVNCHADTAPTLSHYITDKTSFVGDVTIPSDGDVLNIHLRFSTALAWPYTLRLARDAQYFEQAPTACTDDRCLAFNYDQTKDTFATNQRTWDDLAAVGSWTSPPKGTKAYDDVLNSSVKVTTTSPRARHCSALGNFWTDVVQDEAFDIAQQSDEVCESQWEMEFTYDINSHDVCELHGYITLPFEVTCSAGKPLNDATAADFCDSWIENKVVQIGYNFDVPDFCINTQEGELADSKMDAQLLMINPDSTVDEVMQYRDEDAIYARFSVGDHERPIQYAELVDLRLQYSTHIVALMEAAGEGNKPEFVLIDNGKIGAHWDSWVFTQEFPVGWQGEQPQDLIDFEIDSNGAIAQTCSNPSDRWWVQADRDQTCDDSDWYAAETAYRGTNMQNPKLDLPADCDFTKNDQDNVAGKCRMAVPDEWRTGGVLSAGESFFKIQMDPKVNKEFRVKDIDIVATYRIHYWADPNFEASMDVSTRRRMLEESEEDQRQVTVNAYVTINQAEDEKEQSFMEKLVTPMNIIYMSVAALVVGLLMAITLVLAKLACMKGKGKIQPGEVIRVRSIESARNSTAH